MYKVKYISNGFEWIFERILHRRRFQFTQFTDSTLKHFINNMKDSKGL